jgi:hypothetical protein
MTASVGVGATGVLLEHADRAARPATAMDVLKEATRRVQNTELQVYTLL